MTKQRASAIIAALLVTILLWVAALSNGLGSNGAAAAATQATRSTPVTQTAQPTVAASQQQKNTGRTRPEMAIPSGSVSGSGTSTPTGSTGSNGSQETGSVVGFGDGAGGDD